MLKNWRTIAKIVVAVLTALLGTVGATLADSVAPLVNAYRSKNLLYNRLVSAVDIHTLTSRLALQLATVHVVPIVHGILCSVDSANARCVGRSTGDTLQCYGSLLSSYGQHDVARLEHLVLST